MYMYMYMYMFVYIYIYIYIYACVCVYKRPPRYGVPFVDPASDLYSASVPVIISGVAFDIGLSYNGTRMCLDST